MSRVFYGSLFYRYTSKKTYIRRKETRKSISFQTYVEGKRPELTLRARQHTINNVKRAVYLWKWDAHEWKETWAHSVTLRARQILNEQSLSKRHVHLMGLFFGCSDHNRDCSTDMFNQQSFVQKTCTSMEKRPSNHMRCTCLLNNHDCDYWTLRDPLDVQTSYGSLETLKMYKRQGSLMGQETLKMYMSFEQRCTCKQETHKMYLSFGQRLLIEYLSRSKSHRVSSGLFSFMCVSFP